MSHLRSASESVFTCATVVGACGRSLHRSHGSSARSSQFRKLISIGSNNEGFLSERNELAMYQCISRKLSSCEVVPTDGIAAVQYYVSWSGVEQTKIGHRSYDPSIPHTIIGRPESPNDGYGI